jgi:hypothetical protein
MSFESPKERQVVESEHFKFFSKDIDYLIDFFSSLSKLTLYNGRIISFFSNVEHFSLSTEFIDSSVQTLKSIKLCCSIGSFSDANTLIRKFRDDLIQFVYILNIINLRKPFVEESIQGLDFSNQDNFVNSFFNL